MTLPPLKTPVRSESDLADRAAVVPDTRNL